MLTPPPQVEHRYCMHITGDYVSSSGDFSSSKWLSMTELYIDKIQNDLNSENWMAIFEVSHHLQELRMRDELVEVRAPSVMKQCEALLPADPPTPPPLD